MSRSIRIQLNQRRGDVARTIEVADQAIPRTAIENARAAISSWPAYAPTPLLTLRHLADHLRVNSIRFKYEGSRFGVASFKPLGGGYAVERLVARHVAATTGSAPSVADLVEGRYAHITSELTVTCATDGNHGRAVAWAARTFGCRAVVFMAEIVSPGRAAAIANYGAEVKRVAGNHEETSLVCYETARDRGWSVISETRNATDPRTATETLAGYSVLLIEAQEQLDGARPTHVFVPAGVGGLAAASVAWSARTWPDDPPRVVVVESQAVACVLESIAAGKPQVVGGKHETIMAGLAAGEVSSEAWPLLSHGSFAAVAINDGSAAEAMRILAEGRFGDPPLASGESGAAGLAACYECARTGSREIGLDGSSEVLALGTEGPTDEESFERITGTSAATFA